MKGEDHLSNHLSDTTVGKSIGGMDTEGLHIEGMDTESMSGTVVRISL